MRRRLPREYAITHRMNGLIKTVALAAISCAGFTLPAALAAQDQADAEEPPVAGVPELPPAVFDETLAIGGDEIEAKKLRSRMTVEVMVNDTGPYKFVVDSGADTSVVGTRIAEKLGLASTEPAMLHGITESALVQRVEVDSLQIGPSTITHLDLPVLKEVDLGGDGMIGLDALVEQRLMLDFEERVITVDDQHEEYESLPGEIIVTGRLQRGQLILTEVEAQGRKVEAVIDTGTEVTIGNLALRDEIIRRRKKDVQTVEVIGVTGATATLEFAVIPKLKLGSVTFRNVTIAFADVPPFEVFGINDGPSLLLGTDLMEKFRRVSLDFRERKVRFQLKDCKSRRMSIRTVTQPTRLSADRESACAR